MGNEMSGGSTGIGISYGGGYGAATLDIINFNGGPDQYGGPFTTYGGGAGLLGLSLSYTPESKGWMDFPELPNILDPTHGHLRHRLCKCCTPLGILSRVPHVKPV